MMGIPLKVIAQRGYGSCPRCHEPLRSTAMIDVFRYMQEDMEAQNSGSNENPRNRAKGTSLVEEAEDALKRGRDAMDDASKKSYAISKFTHAINAINYLTSASNGERFLLRAKDIFIIAHHERAVLEGKMELCAAILEAFPKQSHRRVDKGDGVFQLSMSAFQSLFYPLPASSMVGSSGTLLRVDMRGSTKDEAFQLKDWKSQLKVAKMDADELRVFEMSKQAMPHCDGSDLRFDSLGGKCKGVFVYHSIPRKSTMGFSVVNMGNESFQTSGIIQFVRSFLTDTAAQEYTRLIIESKEIGEERGAMNSKEDAALTKSLKKTIKGMDVNNCRKLFVLKGSHGPMIGISVVVAIYNVSTKIFIGTMGGDNIAKACRLIATMVSYLDRQLQVFRVSGETSNETPLPDLGAFAISTNRLPIRAEKGYPDITLCAFCGKEGEPSLRKCSQCSLAKYCSVDCQKKHWVMKGPFAHKPFCKGGQGETE